MPVAKGTCRIHPDTDHGPSIPLVSAPAMSLSVPMHQNPSLQGTGEIFERLLSLIGMTQLSASWISETLFAALFQRYRSSSIPCPTEAVSEMMQELAIGALDQMVLTHESLNLFGPQSIIKIQIGWWPPKQQEAIMLCVRLLAQNNAFSRQIQKMDGRMLLQHPTEQTITELESLSWRYRAIHQFTEILHQIARVYPESAVSVHRSLVQSLVQTDLRLLRVGDSDAHTQQNPEGN